MTDIGTFKVVCSGEIAEGYERTHVEQAFSELFKLSAEKAAAFLAAKRVLKKDLSQAKAQAYQKKLASIGVIAMLENTEPEAEGLTLEPMEPAKTETIPAAHESASGLSLEPLEKPDMSEQAGTTSPDDLVQQPPETYIAGERRTPSPEAELEHTEEIDKLNLGAIGAAAAAAIAGALIWKFIVVVFNYELGIVAWGIGGLVGYAALAMGSRGQLCGIVCGVLALFSILGGKYLAISSIQEQALDRLTSEFVNDDSAAFIDEEQQVIARYYVDNVHSEDELRGFIVEYGYSESYEVEAVTQEEIDSFRSYVAPMLEGMADGEFNMAAWLRESYQKEMEDVSNWTLMQESLGLIDIVFLFLGVGTAFRLASGATKE